MNWHEFSLYLKIGLLVVLTLVGLFKLIASRERYARWRVAVLVVLGLCALLSIGTYTRFGNFLYGSYLHHHDISHYYFGAKYADELGYFKLYDCIVTAETEMLAEQGKRGMSKRMRDYQIRDLRTYRHQRLQEMTDNPATAATCKEKFTPERWDSFKEDLRAFYKVQRQNTLYQRCGDMGYNGTPVWGMIMNALSRVVKIDSFNLHVLATLDHILLLVAFGFVFWAFGAEVALMALTFYLCVVFNHRMFILGSILRFDWMAYILIGLSLLKKEYYKVSAFFFALSGLIRLFPFLLMFGLGVKFLFDFFTTREKFRRYVGFFVVYGLTLLILLGASFAYFGVDYYREYTQKLSLHSAPLTSTRAGLPYLLQWEGETKRDDLRRRIGSSGWEAITDHKAQVMLHRLPVRVLFVLSMLAMLAMAMRKREDWEAVALSYALIFLVFAITIYYIIVIALLFILFSWRDNDPRYWVSYAFFMAVMGALYPVHLNVGFGLTQNAIVSASILAVILVPLILFIRSDPEVMAWLRTVWNKTIGRPRSVRGRRFSTGVFFLALAVFLTWQFYPLSSKPARPGWQGEAESFLKTNGFSRDSDLLILTPSALRHEWNRSRSMRRLLFTDDMTQDPFFPEKRVWVLSVGDHFKPETYAARPATVAKGHIIRSKDDGREMRLTELVFPPLPRSTFSFREHLNRAQVAMGLPQAGPVTACPRQGARHVCSKADWNYVGRTNKRVAGDDRLAIWAHPTDPPLTITFQDVTLGDRISIGTGMADRGVYDETGSGVLMEVFAGDDLIGRIETPNRRGWTWHELDTEERKGTTVPLRVQVSAPDLAQRHFVWTGDVLVTQ